MTRLPACPPARLPRRFAMGGFVLAMGTVAGVPTATHAMSVERLSLTERVKAADGIFVGDLVESASAVLGDGVIASHFKFNHVEWLKSHGGTEFVVQVAGGEVGNRGMEILDAPDLVLGCRYLLFIDKHMSVEYPFTGGWQGIFQLVEGAEAQELVVEGHGAVVFSRGGQGIALHPKYGLGAMPGLEPVDHTVLWRTSARHDEVLAVVRALVRETGPADEISVVEFKSFTPFRKEAQP